MIILNYSDLENETLEALDKNTKMVLATCAGNRVTARTMSIIHQGLVVMFQTDVHFTKFQQIKENPNVALSAGNLQIEGQPESPVIPMKIRSLSKNIGFSMKVPFGGIPI